MVEGNKQNLSDLRTELKQTLSRIETLKQELIDVEDLNDKAAIEARIAEVEKTKSEIAGKVIALLESDEVLVEAPESVDMSPLETTAKHEDIPIRFERMSLESKAAETRDPGFAAATSMQGEGATRMRVQQPREYKKGEDFSTFCYRYKIFVDSARVPRHMQANLLLNNVDDDTLQKLAPMVEKLPDTDKSDLNILLAKCHEELYPLSEVRALRQQLTAGNKKQEDAEDVDSFASRLRSIANRAAYSNVGERSEACLNAFLHGVSDELYDKILATPGAENDFEVAVSAGRKFEKMKRSRASNMQMDSQVLQIKEDQSRGSRDKGGDRNQDSEQNAKNNQRGKRKETRTCYRCEKVGHIARNCPEKGKNDNQEPLN